jgi:hypothetical protein
MADDESDELEGRLEGPLDAITCATEESAASSVTVFGLTVDTSTARFHVPGNKKGGCGALSAGQFVRVRLASPTPNEAGQLVAKRVDLDKSNGGGPFRKKVRIRGPITEVDLTAGTVTVYGLLIDATLAHVSGHDDDGLPDGCDCDDDGGDTGTEDTGDDGDDCQSLDLTALLPGQFVQVKLDGLALPELIATHIEIMNFTNAVAVTVVGANGRPMKGAVDVTVVASTKVRDASGRLLTRRQRVQARGSRRVVVEGLATGTATVTVRRRSDGAVRRFQVPILPDRTRSTRVQFR